MTRDVSDVTHRKRGLRFEKSRLVEIETWVRPDEFVRYGRRPLVGLRADDVKAVSIEGLCVSLSLCRKTFKLKGNKKFRTWTKKS